MTERPAPVAMPDLVGATRTFRPTLDSALRTLRRLGLEARVTLESAGPGWPEGSVVRQEPAPGVKVDPVAGSVTLAVAGKSGVLSLPYALRSATTAKAVGADRLLSLFDHQVLRLAHHVRQAGGFLELRPDEPETARRWIGTIFGLRPDDWPRARWYRLARLFPRLHRIAGRAEGLEAAFREVLGLRLVRLRTRRVEVALPPDETTRLGERASRLGVDAVVAASVSAEAGTEALFQVATLHEYRRQTGEAALQRQRLLLYALLLPAHLDPGHVVERWRVGDPSAGTRLADPDHPASLVPGCTLVSARPSATP